MPVSRKLADGLARFRIRVVKGLESLDPTKGYTYNTFFYVFYILNEKEIK